MEYLLLYIAVVTMLVMSGRFSKECDDDLRKIARKRIGGGV